MTPAILVSHLQNVVFHCDDRLQERSGGVRRYSISPAHIYAVSLLLLLKNEISASIGD